MSAIKQSCDGGSDYFLMKYAFRLVPPIRVLTEMSQGIDGSARKPALRQDTAYMVEKTYLDIAPYLGAFGAYVMPQ